MFLGFLPPKAGEKERLLKSLESLQASLIFYESANRLADSLALLARCLGGRGACVARELTKLHEETRRGTLTALASHYAQTGAPKGEIVVIVGPPPETGANPQDRDEALRDALKTLSVKDAAAFVAEQLNLPRKEIYKRALELAK
jgi:16S rRNA (cytidine1402-2'-O)-methyltransferase